MTDLAKKTALAAATALLAVGVTATQAQASPDAGYIGYGYGNNAHGVWCVQYLVNEEAEDAGRGRPLAQDGLWGPQTYKWVRWYQGHEGLSVDGIVGKSTGTHLLREDWINYGGYNYCYTYVPSVIGL